MKSIRYQFLESYKRLLDVLSIIHSSSSRTLSPEFLKFMFDSLTLDLYSVCRLKLDLDIPAGFDLVTQSTGISKERDLRLPGIILDRLSSGGSGDGKCLLNNVDSSPKIDSFLNNSLVVDEKRMNVRNSNCKKKKDENFKHIVHSASINKKKLNQMNSKKNKDFKSKSKKK